MIYFLGLAGVAVFAVSGGLAAGRKKLDWVGVVVLGVATSLGGGTIRDVLLNRPEVFWIANTTYLWVAVLASFSMIFGFKYIRSTTRALLVADALGLALFTIVGAQIAELEGATPAIIVVMGALTGVAGGALRDVLTSEIPLVFQSTETLYSVAALGGGFCYLLLQAMGLNRTTASFLGIAIVAGIRFAAIFWNLRLPAFHVDAE